MCLFSQSKGEIYTKETPRWSRVDISTSGDCCPRVDEGLLSGATSNVLQIVKTKIRAERRSPRSNYSSQDALGSGSAHARLWRRGKLAAPSALSDWGRRRRVDRATPKERTQADRRVLGNEEQGVPAVCEEGQQLQRVPVRYGQPGAFQEVRLQAQAGSRTGHGG